MLSVLPFSIKKMHCFVYSILELTTYLNFHRSLLYWKVVCRLEASTSSREVVRNSESQVLPQTYQIRICIFNKVPL